MLDSLTKLLKMTAWEMEVPHAWGALHVSFLIIGLIASVAAAYALRHADERTNKRVILTVGIFLAASEVYKQLMHILVIDTDGYHWGEFPFQFCSAPLYLCLIIPFLKEGKLRDALYDFLMSFNFMGGLIAFFEPSGLLHEYWTMTLHSLIWHMLLVFLGLYIGFSGRGGRSFAGYRRAVCVFLALSAFAFSMNLLFWIPSGGTINLFFLGPATSSIIVFDFISETFGWYVNLPVFVGSVALGAFILYCPFVLWHKKRGVA